MKIERKPSDNKYRPMKGAHLILNENILEFLIRSLKQIDTAYSDEKADDNTKAIFDELYQMGWEEVEDKFGRKAYEYLIYPVGPAGGQGELRVTVVQTKQGLMLDIRPWGLYQ